MRHPIVRYVGLCLSLALPCGTPALAAPTFEVTYTHTPAGSEDAVMYLTNNAFSDDEQYFVFGRRPRGDNKYLFYRRDMASGEETPIPTRDAASLHGVVSGDRLFVIDSEGGAPALVSIGLRDFDRRVIWALPLDMSPSGKMRITSPSVAAHGTVFAITMADRLVASSTTKLHAANDAIMASPARSYLFVGRQQADGQWAVRKIFEKRSSGDGWLGHVQLTPSGDGVVYELEGNGERIAHRIWYVDLLTLQHTPFGQDNAPCNRATHGYMVGDRLFAYMTTAHDTAFAWGDLRNGTYTTVAALGHQQHVAVFPLADGRLAVIGDGKPDGARTVVRYIIDGARIASRTDVATRGNYADWEPYHVHGRFSPSGAWYVGTYADRDRASVFMVKDPLK
ncbi:MAG: hypothetical protein QM639_10645 [Rhodocyclaceae bacterium]